MIFLNVLFPILVLIAIGYVMTRNGYLNAEMISRLTFWILSPALIFSVLYENDVHLHLFLDFGLFVIVSTFVFWGISLLLGKLWRLEPATTAAFSLAVVFGNAGNYGLPLLLFAYGDAGFELGVVYLSTSVLLLSTLGIIIATWGKQLSWEPVLSVFKTPMLYAVILALGARSLGFEIPEFILRPIDLIGDAAIPMMLILLGAQLVGVEIGKRIKLITTATLLRLAVAPVAGLGLAILLGLRGLEQSVAVLEFSMPTAVNALVIASYYNRDPRLVSSVVMTTTALSVITLTILLLIFGAE